MQYFRLTLLVSANKSMNPCPFSWRLLKSLLMFGQEKKALLAMGSAAKPVINLQLLSQLTPRLLIFISNNLWYYMALLKVNPFVLLIVIALV